MAKSPEEQKHEVTLFIWPSGDGFEYQSMNAQCLLAISYFKFLQKKSPELSLHTVSEWSASKSTDGQLPYFKCLCGNSFGSNFMVSWNHFFECQAMSPYTLDSWMDSDDRADAFAYSSMVISAGQTILDLYLYVTYSNYIATTRHAYTTFLPLYANYTIPPAHRKAAIARTEHLGAAFLEMDQQDGSDSSTTINTRVGGADSVPGSKSNDGLFRLRRQQLSLAQKRMRLNSILARPIAVFETMEERLIQHGGKWIAKGNGPSILDAVVIGYLAVILTTKVPDAWAVDIIEDKTPRLVAWAKKEAANLFKVVQT